MTRSPATRRRRDGHRLGRAGPLLAVALTIVMMSGCTIGSSRGVELGHLRDLARRVIGGGAECPLAIPPAVLRPSTVDRRAPIVPLRDDGPGSEAVIGDGLPTEDSVRITCRYDIEGLAVTVVVVGVPKGHAIGTFGDVLAEHGDAAYVLTFMDANADLPVGSARSLPGAPAASFTRIRASHGDAALVLTIDGLRDDATLPTAASVDTHAIAIARSIAS